MAVLHYRLTTMFPDEYLYWLATVASAQVEAHRGKGLVSHRVFQDAKDPQQLVIVDEWEGEPQVLNYLYLEEIEGGLSWTSVTAGPTIMELRERGLELAELREALGIPERPQEDRPLL